MDTYLFTGALITREPLAYSPPDHRGPDKRWLLLRMMVPSAAGVLETVFLSGANIRGKLRHACADVWLERERTVTLRRFLECKVGGVKGRGAEVRVGLTARAAYLDDDPFLSLFGAGSSPIGWIHSRLDVGAALPDEPTQPILVKGVRSDATTDPMLLKVLDPHERPAVLEGQAANRSRSQAAAEHRALTRRLRQEKKAKHDTTELERALDAAHQAEQEAVRTCAGSRVTRLEQTKRISGPNEWRARTADRPVTLAPGRAAISAARLAMISSRDTQRTRRLFGSSDACGRPHTCRHPTERNVIVARWSFHLDQHMSLPHAAKAGPPILGEKHLPFMPHHGPGLTRASVRHALGQQSSID